MFEAKQGNLLGKRQVQGVYRLYRAERRIERRRKYRRRRGGAPEVLLDRRPATLYRSAAEGYPLRRAQAVLGQGAPIAFHSIAKMSMIGGRNQQGQLRVAELQKMSRAAISRVEIVRADRIEVRMASRAVDQNRWWQPRGETRRRPKFIVSGHHEQAVNLSRDERLNTPCFRLRVGLAVQALQAAGVSTGDAPIADAASWMVGQQDAQGGLPSSFGLLNTNSSGLGAQAWLGIGQLAPAAKAAGFIGSLSVSCTSLTSGTGFVDDDLGAIAYDESGWEAAATGGIADSVGQWQRASAQALLGLGLPTFADITAAGAAAGLPAAPDCSPPTSTTSHPTSTATAPTTGHSTSAPITPTTTSHTSGAAAPSITLDSSVLTPGSVLGVTVSGAPAEATLTVTLHSDPVLLGSMVTGPDGSAHAEFSIPVTTTVGEHMIAVAGPGLSLEAPLTVVAAEATETTSTIVAASTTTAPSLAATGAPAATIPMAVGGAGMVLAGAGLLLVGRRMRRHQPARHRL